MIHFVLVLFRYLSIDNTNPDNSEIYIQSVYIKEVNEVSNN